MFLTCLIEFENNNGDSYWAGQIVNGKVTLTADKVEQATAVTLKIKGCAHTSWEDGMGDDKTSYSGHVNYIKTKTFLFDNIKVLGENITEGMISIQPGIHIIPFTCHIPPECPSSIEGTYGYIRYWVQVTLKRSWKFDKHYKKCFTLFNVHDLNCNRDLRLPVKTEITKNFCCGPCTSDPLEIRVQLPQTGYVPGQLIPVNILVKNKTLTRINEFCVRLVMVIHYFSTLPKNSTSETKTISKLKGDPVLRSCTKNFNYLLPIPATPPTCTTLCSIIQITYRVEVETKMDSLMYRNQCVNTPVTIGNVPLQMNRIIVQQQPMARQINYENGIEISTATNSAEFKVQNNNVVTTTGNENIEPWSALEDIPPPVYMIAAHMPEGKLSENTEHEYGEKCFTPKYPVFNIPSPTSLTPNTGDVTDRHGSISMVMDPDKTTWL